MTDLGHYRLTADHVVERVEIRNENDLLCWAREVWGDDANRRVAFTEVSPGVTVSTVFLGLDHNFGRRGPPLVFETMVFDDYGGGDCFRWATWDEAEAGHYRAVAELKFKGELATLADMPDSEIDLSDIPEQTDWSKAVRGKFKKGPGNGP